MIDINKIVSEGDVIVTTKDHKFYMIQKLNKTVKEMTVIEILNWKTEAMFNAIYR